MKKALLYGLISWWRGLENLERSLPVRNMQLRTIPLARWRVFLVLMRRIFFIWPQRVCVEWLLMVCTHPRHSFNIFSAVKDNASFLHSYQAHLRHYRLSVACSVAMVLVLMGQVWYFSFFVYKTVSPLRVEAANITISGTLLIDSSPINCTIGGNRTVAIAVNGVQGWGGDCTTSDGSYTVPGVSISAAGDVVTVFLDGEVEDAVTITRAANGTSNITGLDLLQNRIIVRHEDSGPITNYNLGQFDGDDDVDIRYTSNAGAFVTTTNTTELFIANGKSYTPGGSVTANGTGRDIHLANNSTLTLDSANATFGSIVQVDTGAILSIGSGRKVTSNSSGSISLDGTISGAGSLLVQHSNLGSGGTLNTNVIFDAAVATITMPARTFAGSNRTVTLTGGTIRPAGTVVFEGNLVTEFDTNSLTIFDVDSSDADVTVQGSFGQNGGIVDLFMGSGTWSVGGDFDLFNFSTVEHNSGTLVMNGTGTLSTHDWPLFNLTISTTGTVTLETETHTLEGDLVMGSTGTIVTTGSAIAITGVGKSITGGGKTLHDLTIDPASTGTISLVASDLTVDGTLVIAANDTLSLNAGRILSTTGSMTLSGSVTGSGTIRFTETASGPGSTGTLSAPVRYDTTNGDIASTILDARTYGGAVELYSGSTSSRTVTLSSGTYNFSSHVYLAANGIGDLSLTGVVNNPTINVAGDLDFTGTGSGTETITSGTGLWTILTHADLRDGSYTATSGNTLFLNGSDGLFEMNSKTSPASAFSTLRIGTAEHVAIWNSDATTITIDSGGSLVSQDHASIDGRLQIYGAARSRVAEFWSAAIDFDGTTLSTPRAADVRFADGASYSVDHGDILHLIGTDSFRSVVTRQSTGGFELMIYGTLDAQYFRMDYMNGSGLNIASTATITSLSDGAFDNASSNNASYITVTGMSTTATFDRLTFDSQADGMDERVGHNITADGASIHWTLAGYAGYRSGELYDHETNGASIDWLVTAVTVLPTAPAPPTASVPSVAPAAPTLQVPVLRRLTQPTFTVTGIGHAGNTVRIYLDASEAGSIKLPGTGNVIVPFKLDIPIGNYSADIYAVGAQSTNNAALSSGRRYQYQVTIVKPEAYRFTKDVRYIVQPQDSLWKIARSYLGNGKQYTRIIRSNDVRYPSLRSIPGVIYSGWLLLLPK